MTSLFFSEIIKCCTIVFLLNTYNYKEIIGKSISSSILNTFC